jgi:hypothetical protein
MMRLLVISLADDARAVGKIASADGVAVVAAIRLRGALLLAMAVAAYVAFVWLVMPGEW